MLAGTVLLLAAGTGAFSSTTADRSVEVAVVPSDQAYLGIESEPIELDNGAHGPITSGNAGAPSAGGGPGGVRAEVTLLTLTNRFAGPIQELTVTPAEGRPGGSSTPPNVVANSLSTGSPPGVGESTAVTARVVCSNANENEETWRFDVVASGDSFSVETTATVTVRCTGDPPAGAVTPPSPSRSAPASG